MTSIFYYKDKNGKEPSKHFIDSLNNTQKAKVFRIFQNIEQYGLSSIQLHIKKLKGTPLWEIRILGGDSIRIIYVSKYINQIIILHGFVKKAQKTSAKEMNISIKRYKDLLDK